MSSIGIVIVDDHPFFREGLKSILGREPDFKVLAEAADARAGARTVADHRPGVVLVDITLPDGSGIGLVRELAASAPGAKCVIISVHCKAEYIRQAFEAGAAGYVTKDAATDRLVLAIRTVLDGGYYIDSAVSGEVVSRVLLSRNGQGALGDSAYAELTPREQEILRLLAEGKGSRDIAAKLFLSPKTVDNHRSRIMGKLGLGGMVDLVRYAVRLGLVDPETWN